MSIPKIVSISVKDPVVPLYEFVDTLDAHGARASTSRNAYFGTGNFPVWISKDPVPSTQPAAISADPTNPASQILIEVDGFASSVNWELSAAYNLSAESSPVLFKASGDRWNGHGPTMISCSLEPLRQVKGSIQALPWGFKGNLVCTFKSNGKLLTQQILNIELYVLSKNLPLHWQINGLPLDLLRLNNLLPTWMLKTRDPNAQLRWSKFVVYALFSDVKMTYDVWQGQQSYAGNSFGGSMNSAKTVFWLDLWLSDMLGITERRTIKEKYAVNCADLAYLVEAVGSLGALSQPPLRALRVEPFGFINDTYLIGRHKDPNAVTYTPADICNNPLYGDSSRFRPLMRCDPADPMRSAFAQHMVTLEVEVSGQATVLDACSGPRHTSGQTTEEALKQYLSVVIDTNRLYGGPNPRPGTIKDAKWAEPISVLAPRPSFVRMNEAQDPIEAGGATLYGTLALMVSGAPGLSLMDPCVGFIEPTGQDLITTWTVRKDRTPQDAHEGQVHINVSRFSSLFGAKINYDQRKSKLTGFTEHAIYYNEKRPQDGAKAEFLVFRDRTPCFLMFYHCLEDKGKGKGTTLLVTIDGTLDNPTLPLVEDESVFWIAYSAIVMVGSGQFVGMDLVPPSKQQKVGTIFEVEIKPTTQSVEWWRGSLAHPRDGRALLLGTTVSGNGDSISMRFLPLAVGSEDINFTLFGPNLDEAKATVTVDIKA